VIAARIARAMGSCRSSHGRTCGRRRFALLGAAIAVLTLPLSSCWLATSFHRLRQTGRETRVALRAADEPPAGPLDRVVWSAAEALGNVRASLQGDTSFSDGLLTAATSKEELVSRLRADYDRSYFLTGDVDVELYSEDCEFSDPFAAFRGRDRFVQNLRNLAGGFITDFRVKLLDLDVEDGVETEGASDVVVRSRLRVVLELALPWRPVLGWIWGVRHECQVQPGSLSGDGGYVWRCVAHRESWEVAPAEGVAQIFRPGKGLPRS